MMEMDSMQGPGAGITACNPWPLPGASRVFRDDDLREIARKKGSSLIYLATFLWRVFRHHDDLREIARKKGVNSALFY